MKSALAILIAQIFLLTAVGSMSSPIAAWSAVSELPYRLGPAASALGGAGRAAIDPSEAGWLNPAALVHVKAYHFSLSSQQSHRNQGDGYRDYAFMLADGGEDKIAAGSISYIQRSTLRGGAGAITAEQKDLQVAFGAFFPNRKTSLGFGYRRLIHEQSLYDYTQDTYSVGLLMPIGDGLGIGIVGQDLAGGAGSAPAEARIIPSVGVGAHLMMFQILQLRADMTRFIRDNPRERNDVHLGLESWFRPDFSFRLGTQWLESRDETWFTTGVGFKGPRLSFGYAFEKELRMADGTRHTFDLWLPF